MADLFPVLFGYRVEEKIRTARHDGLQSMVIVIPWPVLEPHEKQALRNHSQTLKQLAGRGGLGAAEAVAIIENRSYRHMRDAEAHAALQRHIDAFTEAGRRALESPQP